MPPYIWYDASTKYKEAFCIKRDLRNVEMSNIIRMKSQMVNQMVAMDFLKVIVMSNIADLIESYILRQLAAQEDGNVELRRTEIADKISCAPSQISYVLSTRFTPARGFRVESRRGLGGFIRIEQVPMRQLVYQDMQEKIDEDTEFSVVQSMIAYLLKHQMITNREAALLLTAAQAAYETMEPEERVRLIRTLFMTLERLS